MAASRRTLVGSVVLLTLAGCSLTSLNGFTGGVANADEGGTGDGAADGPIGDSSLPDVPVTVVDGCSETSCFDMPPGFALVAFGATAKGIACPTGFAAAVDTVESPVVGENACTCGCSVLTQPSCATGTILGYFDTGGAGTCASAGGNFGNNGCDTDGFLGPFGTGNEHKYKPPPPTGGTCKGVATKDAAKLTYAQGRLCQATTIPKCNSKVCLPAVTGGFGACIASAGTVACPAAFPNKHQLGTTASFSCTTDLCDCTGVSASCKGKVNYYATGDCSGGSAFSVLVNNSCISTDVTGAPSYSSHRYVADPPFNVACAKDGSSAATDPTLTDPTTVCCN